ncbi:efflux RND transporter periplasmic adaptor subunit [Luteibacter sp. Lutesp34]|uniref:efflux RND transporter periplasmic adaptor subunit n=1 Tax=Luteibacter sp. Lutesp34 TaxID=3243030 RepID=UPI0039B4E1A7
MTPHIFRPTALLMFALLLGAPVCSAARPEDAAQAAERDPLILDTAAIAAAGIVVDTAQVRTTVDQVRAPGEVKIDAYATALVSPRVASQVVARRAKLGDLVKAGQPLVALSSVDVAETQGQLIVANQDWERVASLGPQAVSARRYNEALVQRDQARAKLKAYGLSEAQIRDVVKRGSAAADGSFELLAPQAGRVTTDDFIVGERVEPGRTLFTLAAESSVWVEARMPPGQADEVRDGARVIVAVNGRELEGRVLRRSHLTDEKTRTVDVRIRVPNEDDLLHPGDLVECRIEIASQSRGIAVPAEAIVLLQNQPTLFVRGKRAGQFEPVPVEVGETRGGWTAVARGLAAGTPYVRKGAFALKARILRSQLGEE